MMNLGPPGRCWWWKDLQTCRVTFSRGFLVSVESDHLSTPTWVVEWELSGQVGCRDYSPQLVEGGSPDQDIVRCFGIDQ